jgi:hypothetical protein
MYHPILRCDKCGRLVRHVKSGVVKRSYECVESRKCLAPEERKLREENAEFNLLIYECVECNTRRGWGNQEIQEG